MKKRLTLLATLFVLVLGCSIPRPAGSQNRKPESRATPPSAEDAEQAAAAMQGLRNRLLASDPDEIGLEGEDAKAKVWGVMMEVGLSKGVASVVSIRDGTASLYTNTGGGILGGYSAREQARRFVAEAEKHLARMKPAKEFPYPTAGRMKFYVLTRDGVYAAEAAEAELVSGRHALGPLFRAGNDVLTGLRTAQERASPEE